MGPALSDREDDAHLGAEPEVERDAVHLLGDAEAAVRGRERTLPGGLHGVGEVERAQRGVEGLHPFG